MPEPTTLTRTYRDYESDDEGREQILRHLHYRAHGGVPSRVPPRVRPSVVESVLMEEIKPGLKASDIIYAGQIARFYRVRPAAARFQQLLQKREMSTADMLGSLAAIRAMADLGEKAQVDAAEQYYGYLLRQNNLEAFADEAVEALFDLPETVTDKQVAEAIRRRMEALKGREDERSQDAVRAFDMHLTATLPIVVEARTQKNKMLAEPDASIRTTSLAGAYIGIDDPDGVDWCVWGAYALREELVRSNEQTIVAAFKAAAEKIPADAEAEALVSMRAAAARAILYFGGDLEEERQEWLAPGTVKPLPLEG